MSGPDFICFGLQKAGTAWLYDQLASCEQMWMPPVREINHFVGNPYKPANMKTLARCEAAGPNLNGADAVFAARFKAGLHLERNLEWYNSLFKPKSGRMSGDISPGYATDPKAQARAYAACPDAKFIFLLRNPIDRFWSAVNMHLRTGKLDQKHVADSKSVLSLLRRPPYAKRSYPSSDLDALV